MAFSGSHFPFQKNATKIGNQKHRHTVDLTTDLAVTQPGQQLPAVDVALASQTIYALRPGVFRAERSWEPKGGTSPGTPWEPRGNPQEIAGVPYDQGLLTVWFP